MKRFVQAIALGVALMSTQIVLVDEAEARAGRARSMRGTSMYRSMGDRGVRNDRTLMNPGARPGFQSMPGQTRPGIGVPAQQPSWSQRNPFLSGMLGGLAGSAVWSGISGMFGGHHGSYGTGYAPGYGPGNGYGHAGGGGFGILPLLLLLGGGWWLFRKMSRGSQERAWAPGQGGWARPGSPDVASQASPIDLSSRPLPGSMGGSMGQQTLDQGLAAIQLNSPGLTRQALEDRLSAVFFGIQEAWSAQDDAAIARLTAPAIAEQFSRDLDEARRHGERNVLRNIVIRRFDMSEAWTEMDREFVTARIQARLIDYVERGGQVVEGSKDEPTDFAETWTFARERGGEDWRLTAIEQV
ncbi:MAG: TIM44-like domain-containing protein [bacterium]|nr:TIM44-like domain-containing protein [bacterium]